MRIVGRDSPSPMRNEADPRVRLLVVDSAPVLLEGLSALLRRQPEFEVISATDTRDLPSIARLAPIDVAIVDIASRSRDGWNDVKVQERMHRIVDLVRFAIGMGLSFVDPKNCFPPGPESESA